MRIQTTHLEELDHAELEIHYDDTRVVKADADWLAGHLSDMVMQGDYFDPEQTIQIGWSLLKFREKNRQLVLCEYDFNDPNNIQWVESVTNTILHLRLQKDAYDSFELPVDIEFANVSDNIYVEKQFMELSNFALIRESANQQNSGWMMRDLRSVDKEFNENDYNKIPLYELACRRKDTVAWLAMPTGSYLPIADGYDVEVIYRDQTYPAKPGSFIAEINLAAMQ